MLADAVFEGGGIKAFGLVGALQVAEEKGYRWKRVAGTSAGSIIASLLAAGYRSEELYRLLFNHNFSTFIPELWYHRIPYLGHGVRLWVKKGLYPSLPLERWVGELLAKKNVYTFADLKEKECCIIASDISRGTLLVLPRDLKEYGISADRFPIARAVRMSCAIPLFFDPVKLHHRPTKKSSVVVDGGVLSNFPVWLFDQEHPRWPTFGFRFLSETAGEPREIHGPISLLRAMFYTMLDAHDNRHIKEQDKVRTIQVPADGVKLTDFDLSPEKRRALYEAGVKAARSFFSRWTFREYLAYRGVESTVTCRLKPYRLKGGEPNREFKING
ncbi:patatin-like phospholipase family protein [Desmospora profundinema]|uniref:NTE family protein n=1 Tax=Desmospora profundinema TaxID=1571184 RepID=A0ABU1IIT1_9BACL|nr:patatin-like phospholipase family protein [Desmospora profundinema]MDR6224674.1 NTE family protein [Desmospora profundinema]